MTLQNLIIEQYQEVHGQVTLKQMSEDTGINMTRMFRLLNGSIMRVDEYQLFQNSIKRKLGFDYSVQELADECTKKLSVEAVKEIHIFLKRKMELWQLIQDNRILANQNIA